MQVINSPGFMSNYTSFIKLLLNYKSTFLLILSLIPLGSQAKNYYIDAVSGMDTNNGTTLSTPWKTLSKVNATTFAAGDSILLKSGCTWIGQLYPKGSGIATKPIVVNNYGTGNFPCIDGNGMTGTGVVYLYNQQYWEINNLEIVNNATSGGDRRGVRIEVSNFGTANHIYLKNLNIHNIKGNVGQARSNKRTGGIGFGIVSVSTADSHFNDILVEGCTIQSCDNQGIITECVTGDGFQPGSAEWNSMKITNAVIRNNTISNISKNAMIIRLFDKGVIEHNVCYNTANGISGNTIFTAGCLNTVFQFNECYSNNSPDADGSMYDADLRSPGTIWQYSYSHDNAHGLFWNCTVQEDDSIVCRYNISQNDHGIIFCVNYPVTKMDIYNNSVYIPSTLSPIIISERNKGGTGSRTYNFKNNIIYNNSTSASYIFTAGYFRNIDANCFYGYHPSNEPADSHKITADPLFVNPGNGGTGLNTVDGYKLKSDSPCKNYGVFIPNNGGRDYWETELSNGKPSIGAFEFPTLSTSGSKILSDKEFLVYPNPLDNSILNINLSEFNIKEKIRVDILTLNGKKIFSKLYLPSSELKIETETILKKGSYLVCIKSGEINQSKKIIVK